MIRGVDISAVQQNVDFQWLVKQGFQFVIVKCFTGNDGKDPFYEKNVAGALAAGLKVGIYHFIYPLPSDPAHPGRDAKTQAAMHYKAAELAGPQKVVCCDLRMARTTRLVEVACRWSIHCQMDFRLFGRVRKIKWS